ncbi:CHAT domain-containing protein [Algoriphagus confluentis]|uniref:CHAT domain-containing protein n=1 Tax=Algoriphagus confluentis TaxID=1697556 RepID=A0ABQ6PTK5_9BACT|nr:hypothetical protein Aconfl_39540 [Algoriphagus confluentis]
MKKLLFLLLFSAFGLGQTKAQGGPDYFSLIQNFKSGMEARNALTMKTNSEQLIKYFNDDYAGYALNGYFLLCRGQNLEAKKQLDVMYQLNPTDAASNSLLSLYYFLAGNTAEAKKHLAWGFQLATFPEYKQEVIHDAKVAMEMASRTELSNYISLVNQVAAETPLDIQTAQAFSGCIGPMMQGQACPQLDQAVGRLNLKKPFNPNIELMAAFLKSVNAYQQANYIQARKGLDRYLQKSEPNKQEQAFFRSLAFQYKGNLLFVNYDYQSALLNIRRAVAEIRNLSAPTSSEATYLYYQIMYETQLKLEEESLQSSYSLLALADKIDNDLYRAHAQNNIGKYFLYSAVPSERARAAEFILSALRLSERGGFTDLENTVRGNYVIVLWQQGKKAEAKENSDRLYSSYMKSGQYNMAEITASSLGFFYYYDQDYRSAANYFKKAVDLTENVRKNLSPEQRLTLMNQRSEAYIGLVMAYQKLEDSKALFAAQDDNRGRFLRDRLSPNARPVTIEEAQALLGPQDLLLYYTLTGPGEIIINAITKNSAQAFYNYPIDDWIGLKKNFTDRSKRIPPSYNSFMQDYSNDIVDGNFITYASKEQSFREDDFKTIVEWTRELFKEEDPKLDPVRNAFLKHWYRFTLEPVAQLLATYPNLIIGASNELNYLPFEAFINRQNQYLIETHNVRYIPSVSVWKILKNRTYSSHRKPALVMGGAIYQPSGNVKGTARGINDFYAISESLSEKISRSDFNFKKELQSMGFGGADYLQGTLDEVTFVGTLSPDVKVVTGMNMKESYLKQLSNSGELKNYKMVMLSTHGFTVDIIPELSGVMMSQPNEGDGNEDTFLLSPEIARLQLQADLAILSACDTGLGALVGGEGINGLNSSFLLAGANRTLLSLWPVNDFSTSLTMQNLFKRVIVDGEDPFVSLNLIKRALATGEGGDVFRHPKYWAPFLLNGI